MLRRPSCAARNSNCSLSAWRRRPGSTSTVDFEAGRGDAGSEILEDACQARALQLWRVDLHDQRAQLLDRVTHRACTLVHRARGLRGRCAAGGARRRRQRVGGAGELWHDAVVEVRGDPPALDVRCVHGALQQSLPLLVARAQPPRERHGEGHLQQPDQRDRAQQCERRGSPDTERAHARLVEALVDLEQDDPTRGGHVNGAIDLEQPSVAVGLEPIFRARTGR